jgi:hypothetical protein
MILRCIGDLLGIVSGSAARFGDAPELPKTRHDEECPDWAAQLARVMCTLMSAGHDSSIVAEAAWVAAAFAATATGWGAMHSIPRCSHGKEALRCGQTWSRTCWCGQQRADETCVS